MKKRNLLFCLLFLFLGTAIAWADKYYMPKDYRLGSNPRLSLESILAGNKKFMIYNTAISGSQDCTGFLRNDGVGFAHDKSKERDMFVYNENFVYTLEAFDTDSDGTPEYYAIKSLQTGTYVDCYGNSSHETPDNAKLSITIWDDATDKAGVNMESWQYSVISNSAIKSGGHGTTVFVIKNYEGDSKTCWNGTTNSFTTATNSHPFAFHEAMEVVDGDYLQDLHMYSRSDIYSAQVIYGYIQQASEITATPATLISQGAIQSSANLNAITTPTEIVVKNLSGTNNIYFGGNSNVSNFNDAILVWEPVVEGQAGRYYLRTTDAEDGYIQASSAANATITLGTKANAQVFVTTAPTTTGSGATYVDGNTDIVSGADTDNLVRFVQEGGTTWLNVNSAGSLPRLGNNLKGAYTVHNVYLVTTTHTTGTTANLLDGEIKTNLTVAAGDGYQFNLGDAGASSVYIYLQRNADATYIPTNIKIEVSNDAAAWTQVGGAIATGLSNNYSFTSGIIDFGGTYKYVRISNNDVNAATSLSEVYILPNSGEIQDAINYINRATADGSIYTKATQKEYARIVNEYNADHDISDARLLSGVPIPGNKYRIYADAYDIVNGVYVNQEVMASDSDGADEDTYNDLLLMPYASYHNAGDDEKEKYEWYCEQTINGKLVFKNVYDPTKYLGNAFVSDEPYEWTINTALTQRFGVPLKNNAQQYLTAFNDGSAWQGNVTTVQNQTVPNASIDHDNNDETEDIVIPVGLCTDFLFIPVPIDEENEKKLTFKANELVQRNTKLLFDADGDGNYDTDNNENYIDYPMPFSRMFKKGEKLPALQLLCSELHSYADSILVNGVKSTDADFNDNKLTFSFDDFENGDVIEIPLTIEKPFDMVDAEFDTTVEPALYLIKNMRPQSLMQQARPRRAGSLDIEIGDEGEGPISQQTGKLFYAKFNTRSSNMLLVEGAETVNFNDTKLDATSLFYFTPTEIVSTDEYYSVKINNATTVMRCANTTSWNKTGNTWYVQPHITTSYSAYNIGNTLLNATNNPGSSAWCSDHADGDRISPYFPNDDGAAWEFIKVDAADANKLLNNFITDVANKLDSILDVRKTEALTKGYDTLKIKNYLYIVEELKERATEYYDGTTDDVANNRTAKLLQYAQNIHMIEHEIGYALYELPLTTDKEEIGKEPYEHPHWYYVKNVNSDNHLATYNGDSNEMRLDNTGAKLKNMFYFVGEKNTYNTAEYEDLPGNNLIIDEYLKVNVHNFAAGEKVLASKNKTLLDETPSVSTADGKQTVSLGGNTLTSDESWSIEMDFALDGMSQFNAWGSCLLTSSEDVGAVGYYNEFQVFFKDDRSIVVKYNNSTDAYRFTHTQDAFSKIKVTITNAKGRLVIAICNSENKTEEKVLTKTSLNDISELYAGLPEEGITMENLVVKKVEVMTWKESDDNQWYILPSSNEEKRGFAIVMDNAFDTNMGWTNETGSNNFVTTNVGTADNSTWEFVKVTDFDDHIDELLAMYDWTDCVIYDKELAKLLALIKEKEVSIKDAVDGANEEADFNEVYAAVSSYKGRMPDELRAPKPGSLYTIRPASDEESENALLVHIGNSNAEYSTKEMYKADAIRDDKSYDTRSVWEFEGSATDGFFALNGLKAKNIHTQLYVATLDNEASLLSETPATITLNPLGACTTYIKVGERYMSIDGFNYAKNGTFWGSAINDYPAELQDSIPAGATIVAMYGKSVDVAVNRVGDVTVTFKHVNGDHKLNILGVELTDTNGDVVARDYHHGLAGGSLVNNVFTLTDVAKGDYTLNIYVCDLDGTGFGDRVVSAGGYFAIGGVAGVKGSNKIANNGDENTRWIIEEIEEPETSIYFPMDISTHGHSTLMLGFDAKIPNELQAFWPRQHGDIHDVHFMSMTSYEGGILPANTPVMLRLKGMSSDPTDFVANAQKTPVKFYYSKTAFTEETPDKMSGVLFGALYNTLVRCADYRDGGDANNRIYMLQNNKDVPKLYRIWENRNDDGTKCNPSATDDGGHIICSANKAYWVLPYDYEPAAGIAFSLRYEGGMSGTTDIENIEIVDDAETETVETIFDLQGRKLNDIIESGIYIINGTKVIVK